jgi:chitosanase
MAQPAVALALSELQKLTAQAIVNVFETGSVRGDCGRVTLLPGDPGHLTYGRSQTTLASGNLHLLVKAYCAAPRAAYAAELQPYLAPLAERDLRLDHDLALRRLLRAAGQDPVMQETQDGFFDRVYWAPAVAAARHCRVRTPLGMAVVYDGKIHGSFERMRDRVNDAGGPIAGSGDEARWITDYIATRRAWLAGHRIPILRKTVYRMDCFAGLAQKGNWTLALPIVVLGRRIDEGMLEQPAVVRASAEDVKVRVLRLTTPPMEGKDVRAVQRALSERGYDVPSTGAFDQATRDAAVRFQRAQRLVADGIVGPATRAALGL